MPVVSRGNQWVDGQAIEDLARFVNVAWSHRALPPKELARRVGIVLSSALATVALIPDDKLGENLPGRPRPYRQLATHVGDIVEAFLGLVEQGKPHVIADLDKPVPDHIRTSQDIVAFQAGVLKHFQAWWAREGEQRDYSVDVDVYYGEQTLHEYFERTTWHSAQHVRQLQYALELMGISVPSPLSAADLAGLPMPDNVWDG